MKECNLSISRRKGIVLAACALLVSVLLAGCSSQTPKAAEPTESPKVEEVAVADAAAGLEYMKNSCTTCHSVPDPSTIKPFDEVTGRAFLADHMVKSGEEDLNNMIAYFFPSN